MKFTETKLKDAYLIELEPSKDDRGSFARTFCQKEFKENGIDFNIVQTNISKNHKKGTLRGMHFQRAPHEEAKVVTCSAGSLLDVIIDIRPGSDTYTEHFSVELTAKDNQMLYIPKGFAHGFVTLEDNTDVSYLMSEFYHPGCADGIRWNDSAFKINWPLENPIMSEKDLNYPDFKK